MKPNNSLDIPVFQDELDFKTLENILECLDHVTPKKVSRSEYTAMKGNFLVETGEDKFGKSYDLFLPEDLVHGELLNLIDFLSKKFGIENYTPYSRIITKTKVVVGLILRGALADEGEKYIQELAEKYSLSPEFIKRLKSQKEGGEKMSFSETKKMIKSIKSKRKEDNNEKVGKNPDDIALGFEELKELFGEQFDLTFFRKGVNMLRLGMMTITQAEQRSLKEKGQKKGETISFNLSDELLDTQEKLLRDKIGIDELKVKLEKARKSGNITEIIESEYNAVNKVLEVLYEYPYQNTKNNYGFQPNKIAIFKEIYCVGFSLLGHAFLTELGISHNGLNLPKHSAIEVKIGKKGLCYFDPIVAKIAIPFEYGENKGIYKEIKFLTGETSEKKFAYSSKDVEKTLLVQLMNNKGSITKNNNQNQEIYNKVLKYQPKLQNSYVGKGISHLDERNYKLFILYNYASKLMEGKSSYIIEIFFKKETTQIKQLIDSQDFEGLRLYLLELEKQDN